jgi:uncharacterized protein
VIPRSFFLLALLLQSIALGCNGPKQPAPEEIPQSPAAIFPDGWSVRVDLATTPEQQARGLMFVQDLPPDRGMLFLFDSDEQRPFWMKNCLISIDIIWLDEGFRVVDISRDIPPCKGDPCPNVFPSRAIRNVLEVQAGLCAAHGLSVGDAIVVAGLPSPAEGKGAP